MGRFGIREYGIPCRRLAEMLIMCEKYRLPIAISEFLIIFWRISLPTSDFSFCDADLSLSEILILGPHLDRLSEKCFGSRPSRLSLHDPQARLYLRIPDRDKLLGKGESQA